MSQSINSVNSHSLTINPAELFVDSKNEQVEITTEAAETTEINLTQDQTVEYIPINSNNNPTPKPNPNVLLFPTENKEFYIDDLEATVESLFSEENALPKANPNVLTFANEIPVSEIYVEDNTDLTTYAEADFQAGNQNSLLTPSYYHLDSDTLIATGKNFLANLEDYGYMTATELLNAANKAEQAKEDTYIKANPYSRLSLNIDDDADYNPYEGKDFSQETINVYQ